MDSTSICNCLLYALPTNIVASIDFMWGWYDLISNWLFISVT